jgi:cold shock protein
MPIGTCKFWRADKGFGFLMVGNSHDVFVHVSQVRHVGYAALVEGQRLRFEVGANPRTGKPVAVDLKLMEPVVSPKVAPTWFRAGQAENRDEQRALAEASFMRSSRPADVPGA